MPASSPVTTESFDNVQMLMDVVDTVRHARQDDERLMTALDSDEELVAKVRGIYDSQGLPVDEATIRQGLDLMKSRRFEFQPPKPSLALKAAQLYITRAAWGPKFLWSAATVGALATSSVALVLGVSAYRFNAWKDDAAASLQAEAALAGRTLQLSKTVRGLPATPRPVADGAGNARQALNEAERVLVGLPVLPKLAEDREAFYEQDAGAARKLVATREGLLGQAKGRLDEVQKTLTGVAALQVAYRGVAAFDQATPSYLESLRDSLKQQFESAAAVGNAAGMDAAVRQFETALSLDSKRVALAAQVNGLSGASVGVLAGTLAETQSLLVAGNLAAAKGHLDDVAAKLAILPLSYTLRIVSEEGERSGVWRYYDNNRSARSYYIVVDAVDASGAKVTLPITSAEDKQVREVSRFAVRVPEHVYEAVGKDKQADGIVDNDQFGRKAAGELDATYAFETLGGTITQW